MKYLLIVTFLGIVCLGFSCPNGWIANGSKCYHFSREEESWVEAVQVCKQIQGTLLQIEDAAENAFIQSQAQLTNVNYWIDLTDIEQEGTWVWMESGTPLSTTGFSDWNDDPANYKDDGEDCAGLYEADGHKWAVTNCADNYNYICERDNTDGGSVVG
ncbi:hypothetical protein ACF0H5_002615 [Mactra antiquata]